MPHGLVVFYRFFFALLLLLPLFYLNKSATLKTSNMKLMLLRGASGFLTTVCWLYALKYLPTTNVILLSDTAPIFVPLIAFEIWRQRISYQQALLIMIVFVGVIFVLHPNHQSLFSFPALIGLCSGFLLAISLMIMRQLGRTEPSPRIVLYFYAAGVIYSVLFSSYI